MNALEKCLDMLMAIVIMFLLPLLFYGGNSRVLRSVSAGAACENFLQRVSTAGTITLPVWKELEDSLERFNCDTFELSREYTLWEPGAEMGCVTEQSYIDEKETLLQEIQTEGFVGLHRGDRLQVTFYTDGFPTVYYSVVRSEGKTE